MKTQETGITVCLCEGNLSGWETESWKDRRLFNELPFLTFWILFHVNVPVQKVKLLKNNNSKTTGLWKLLGVPSLKAQYNINHWPQRPENSVKEMRLSLLWEHYSLLMRSETPMLGCDNVRHVLVLFILTAFAKLCEREMQTKMGKKLKTSRESPLT